MPTGHTMPLPLSTWDRDTLVAVAVAYRRVRRLGARDLPARQAAETAYLVRHPTVPAADAQQAVALMISAVARDHSAWLWRVLARLANRGSGWGPCIAGFQFRYNNRGNDNIFGEAIKGC